MSVCLVVDLSWRAPERTLLRSFGRITDRMLARRLLGIAVASFSAAGLDGLGLLLLVPLISALSESGAASELPVLGEVSLGVLVGLVVMFFLVKTLLASAIRWWSSGVVARSSAESATAYVDACMNAPLEFHDRRNSSSAVNMVQSTLERVFNQGLLGFTVLLAEGATVLVVAAIVLFASPVTALIAIAYYGLTSVVYVKVIRQWVVVRARASEDASAISIRALQEGLGGLREHRVRGTENATVDAFATHRLRALLGRRIVNFAADLPRYYMEVLFIGGFGVVTALTLSSGGRKEALTGLALMLGAGFRILPSISRVITSVTNVRAARSQLDIVLDDLDALRMRRLRRSKGTLGNSPELVSSMVGAASVSVEDVSFSYPGSSPVLSGISLEVGAGQSLGVVGPSGAGKSTLVDLLCDVRTPTTGVIELSPEGRRTKVGLVPQEVFVLDADITSNVAFGLPVDDSEIERALRLAQLWNFVESLPDGPGTVVGERGTRISGGQRQRLGIARAVYGRPSIIIFDEATASLDVETESEIIRTIDTLANDVTVIIVAHRLSTIRHCDQVAYLDAGQLVGLGTFEEVADQVPAFARAVALAGMKQ